LRIAVIFDPCIPDGAAESTDFSRPDLAVPAREIEAALQSRRHEVSLLAVAEDPADFLTALCSLSPDLVVNLCEGIRGRAIFEVHVAALLELLDVPFTGNGALALALCLDKARANAVLTARGVPTPRHRVVTAGEPWDDSGLQYPIIVKPVREDASVGIDFDGIVSDRRSLQARAAWIAERFGGEALVEEYVDGRELNVAVLDSASGPEILPIAEIDFSGYAVEWPRILSYDAKWNLESEAYRKSVPVCPAPLTPNVEERVRGVSLQAIEALGCRGYTRVDLRLDRHDVPYVLEVNPNPDLSPDAGLARAARVAGWSYPDLVERIARGALRPHRSAARRADLARPVG
jgi:D-alanine-D-alanine ligase